VLGSCAFSCAVKDSYELPEGENLRR
jgi:hypothetical protein